jgi:hypothetical protein
MKIAIPNIFIHDVETIVVTKYPAAPTIEININDGTIVITVVGVDSVMPTLEMKEEPT